MQDPVIENVLNRNTRVTWEYKASIALSSIEQKRSHQNQARVEDPIDRELVKQYTVALRNGDQFPAIVVYEDGGSYVVMDGNHRVEAHLAEGRGSIDAYIVLASDSLERQLITAELNTLNGRPPSEEDKDAHAVTLVKAKIPQKHVAERLHMSESRVSIAVHDYDISDRASNLGAESAYKKIPSKVARVRIGRELTLDKVFIEALKFQVAYNLGRNELYDFLAKIVEHGSETDQLAYIKNKKAAIDNHLAAQKALRGQRKTPPTKARKNKRYDNPVNRLGDHLQYFIKKSDFEGVRGALAVERTELLTKIAKARLALDVLEAELT